MRNTTLHAIGHSRKNTQIKPEKDLQYRLSKRDAWVKEIDPSTLFHRLFDLIPGIYFFAKNRQGELMFLSRNNRNLSRLANEADVVGLTDFDLNPPDMARAFVRDDVRIYKSGKPLLNRVELWFDHLGIPGWFLVNKMPIRSRDGRIIGIMGFSQNYEGRTKLLPPSDKITVVVNYIRQNHHDDITVEALASLSKLSVRQLQRKFKAAFGVSPQQFLIKTRLLTACHALRETDQSMSDVAYGCGFSDQSAFARHFRQHIGMTPSEFRRQPRASA